MKPSTIPLVLIFLLPWVAFIGGVLLVMAAPWLAPGLLGATLVAARAGAEWARS